MKLKSRSRVPVDADDFKLFNKKVPQVLQGLAEEGYRLVIFRQGPQLRVNLVLGSFMPHHLRCDLHCDAQNFASINVHQSRSGAAVIRVQ